MKRSAELKKELTGKGPRQSEDEEPHQPCGGYDDDPDDDEARSGTMERPS